MHVRVAILLILAAFPSLGTAAEWKSELKASIESTFRLSKLHLGGLSPDFNTVSQPGTQLLIRAAGVDGDIASNASVPVTIVEDGHTRAATGGLSGLLRNEASTRTFQVGERVFLYDVSVRSDHTLFLNLISCDKYEVSKLGSTQQVRYKGILRFEFPKNYLAAANFKDVRAAIEAIMAPPTESETSGTKTASLGQSPEQVQANLGKPDKIIDLGPKVVFVYKDLKIIFQDGKVADVQ